MRDSRQEMRSERRDARPGLEGVERAKAVRRCIAAWKDLTMSRKEWEARFPEYIRDEARHSMPLDVLRFRG